MRSLDEILDSTVEEVGNSERCDEEWAIALASVGLPDADTVDEKYHYAVDAASNSWPHATMRSVVDAIKRFALDIEANPEGPTWTFKLLEVERPSVAMQTMRELLDDAYGYVEELFASLGFSHDEIVPDTEENRALARRLVESLKAASATYLRIDK